MNYNVHDATETMHSASLITKVRADTQVTTVELYDLGTF